MAELKYWNTGISEITIDARDTFTVIAAPPDGPPGNGTKVHLHAHRILGLDGMVLSPGDTWVTVYESASQGFLFLVNGERPEEEIRMLIGGPDEEKSELLLERICVLSQFGQED